MTHVITPTEQLDRIYSLDFLRGIAVLGILFINVENFAYPDSWSPWKYGFESTIDRDTRFWVYFLTQGKFYNMFALLFGVGFYIFLERLEHKQIGLKAMDIFSRRLLWLFLIGTIHAYFIWDGDVLYHYSICGFLLFPFRSMNKKALLVISGILVLTILSNTYVSTANRINSFQKYTEATHIPESEWTAEQRKRNTYWTGKLTPRQPDTIQVSAPKQTYLKGLKASYDHSKLHKGLVYHSGILFPTLLIMIAGILLYRAGIFHDYKKWKHYWLMSISVLIVALFINYIRYYQWTYQYDDPVVSHWQAALFTFPKESLGLAYVLILNGLYQKFLKNKKIKVFTKIGKIALSNYILQNVLAGIVFYGYGFAKHNQYTRFELIGIVLIIWTIQIIFTVSWLSAFKQGPLESLWRKLTYNSFKKR